MDFIHHSDNDMEVVMTKLPEQTSSPVIYNRLSTYNWIGHLFYDIQFGWGLFAERLKIWKRLFKDDEDPEQVDRDFFFGAIADSCYSNPPAWDHVLKLQKTGFFDGIYWDAKAKRFRAKNYLTEAMKKCPSSWWEQVAQPSGDRIQQMVTDLEDQLSDYYGRPRGIRKQVPMVDTGCTYPSWTGVEVRRSDLLEGIAMVKDGTMYVGTKKYEALYETLKAQKQIKKNLDLFKSPELTEKQQEFSERLDDFIDQTIRGGGIDGSDTCD